jgi:hypothetical protein
MKTIFLSATMLVLCITNATGQGKLLTKDPLTDPALIPATDSGKHMANISYIYNEPTKMPGGQVCKSKMQANFYLLYNIKMDAALRGIPRIFPASKRLADMNLNVRKPRSTTRMERLWLL